MSAAVLTGCFGTRSDDEIAKQNWKPIFMNDVSIQIPIVASQEYIRPDGSTAYATYIAPTIDYSLSDFLIEIYPPSQSAQEPIECTPAITGASKTEILDSTNGNSIWGRVDVWEKFGEGDIPDWENVICRKDGIPPPDEVYALCSEKDGKRVLICISQMTDNPQLAEEIFGTFRWED